MEHRAVEVNALQAVADLRRGSELLDRTIQADGLGLVGALYSVESGAVEFLDVHAAKQ